MEPAGAGEEFAVLTGLMVDGEGTNDGGGGGDGTLDGDVDVVEGTSGRGWRRRGMEGRRRRRGRRWEVE